MNERILDVHAHFLPDFYVNAMRSAGIEHPDGFPIPNWSPEAAIAFMDQHGIAAQVVSISSPWLGFVDGRAAVDLARRINEYAAGLIRDHAPRFGAMAVLPLPNVEAALAEIAYAFDTLGLDGIGLLSNYHGVYLGDPAFDQIFAELNRRKALVFVHPTTPPHFDAYSQGIASPFLEFPFDTTRMAVNLVKTGTMRRNQDIRMVLSHGGGTIPYLYLRLMVSAGEDAPRAFPSFFYDLTAATSPGQTTALKAVVPVEQLMLGFDFPFMDPKFTAPAIKGLEAGTFTPEQLTAIRFTNGAGMFSKVAARLAKG